MENKIWNKNVNSYFGVNSILLIKYKSAHRQYFTVNLVWMFYSILMKDLF